MSVDIKEMRNEATQAEETVANTATGAVVSMASAMADPVGTTRRQVRKLSRRGEPVNRRVARRAERTAEEIGDTADDIVSGNLAERIALRGIRRVRNRARRTDLLGDVLHGGLSLVNTVLEGTARELGKFREASKPPARTGGRRTSSARRSTARRARTASTARRRTTTRRTRAAVRRAS